MTGIIDNLERAQLRRVPAFQAGDRLKVHFQVVEGNRRWTQVFEGVVIKRQGAGARETFTVRKQSFGEGVERTFPVHSPKIERFEIVSRGDVRRAKLYYLRGRVGRRARVRERRWTGAAGDELAMAGPEPAGATEQDEPMPEADEAVPGPDESVPDAEPDLEPVGDSAGAAGEASEAGAGAGEAESEEAEPAQDEAAASVDADR